jgi:SM-20-related protein
MDFLTMTEQLRTSGYCVWPGFLEPSMRLEVRDDLDRIKEKGGFIRAGTGKGKGREVRDQIRRDEIHWLDPDTNIPVQLRLHEKLNSLRLAFNRGLYLGLVEFEGHYAAYPSGGFYKRHLDCFKSDDARMVSIILYLNHDWKARDGGRLRIYANGSQVNVDPVGGTLVCFLSRELEHEVLLSHAARFSFAGWFKSSQSQNEETVF